MGSVDKKIEAKVVDTLRNQKPTCGDCVGFECEILRDKKLCSSRGVLEHSKPCRQFIPDTTALAPLAQDEDTFIGLARLMDGVDEKYLRKLGALMMREKQTRAQGYQMGMRVYVRYRGLARSNYLSNFMSAYIMYADTDTIRVCSRDGKLSMTFVGKARDAIFSADEFEKIHDRMLRKRRYVDPDVQRQISKHLRCLEEYELDIPNLVAEEIPTIDKVFKSSKVRGAKKHNDLVGIVNQIESGYHVSKKAEDSGSDSGSDSTENSKKKGQSSSRSRKRSPSGSTGSRSKGNAKEIDVS